jgi:translation initiation factor 2 beta subunit (eIF-2beta)/eIF-5
MNRKLFSGSKANRDRRDQSYARSVIAEAWRRHNAVSVDCATCGEPAPQPIWAGNGKYAFCSDHCCDEYYKALEGL